MVGKVGRLGRRRTGCGQIVSAALKLTVTWNDTTMRIPAESAQWEGSMEGIDPMHQPRRENENLP
jgi:hypothetical protein